MVGSVLRPLPSGSPCSRFCGTDGGGLCQGERCLGRASARSWSRAGMRPPKRRRGGRALLFIGAFICKINELILFYGRTHCRSCCSSEPGGKQSVSVCDAPCQGSQGAKEPSSRCSYVGWGIFRKPAEGIERTLLTHRAPRALAAFHSFWQTALGAICFAFQLILD